MMLLRSRLSQDKGHEKSILWKNLVGLDNIANEVWRDEAQCSRDPGMMICDMLGYFIHQIDYLIARHTAKTTPDRDCSNVFGRF